MLFVGPHLLWYWFKVSRASRDLIKSHPKDMPVPDAGSAGGAGSGEPKSGDAWLLTALDLKFAEQERAIERLLDQVLSCRPGPELLSETAQEREPVWEVSDLDAVATLQPALEPEHACKISAGEEPKPDSRTAQRFLWSRTQLMRERWKPDPPLKSFVKGPLDGYMGIVVIVNLIFMVVMTQWMGSKAHALLNLPPSSRWNLPENFFEVSEYVFFAVFFLDVVIRILVLRREWYYDNREGFMYLNIFDACVVLVNAFELIILPLQLARCWSSEVWARQGLETSFATTRVEASRS